MEPAQPMTSHIFSAFGDAQGVPEGNGFIGLIEWKPGDGCLTNSCLNGIEL